MKVLYYAHHHGSGHLKNATLFKEHLKEDLWIASSRKLNIKNEESHFIELASEDPTNKDLLEGRDMLPNYLHYSPIGNPNIQSRSFQILKNCIENKIQLALVDLSVEVASLLRAASIPFAYVRLPGNRNDRPHLECFRSALFLLAYYPKELEDENTLDWVVEKTIYLGFLKTPTKQEQPNLTAQERELIEIYPEFNLVVKGFGGHELVDENVSTLKEKASGNYVSVGPITVEFKNVYDYIIPYSDHVNYLMKKAQRIIIPPSLNLTAEALQARKPVTVIPDDRHFNEHEIMAKNLIKNNYADSILNQKNDFKIFNQIENPNDFINLIKDSKDIHSFYKQLNIS